MKLQAGYVARCLVVAAASVSLSGCLIAAVPLVMAAAGGAAAFGAYKVVQTSTGGAVHVGFGSTGNKDVPPAAPLKAPQRLAVWPGGAKEARFAEKQGSKTDVVLPSAVARSLQSANMSTDLRQLTAGERANEYAAVCKSTRADVVASAIDLGQTKDSNILSFKRGGTTQSIELAAFDCRKNSVVWQDKMNVISETGAKATTPGELEQIEGDAWADRITQAEAAAGQ